MENEERYKYLTKQEVTYQRIKDSIISGVYKPGQRLVLAELEREIGTSNMPIREALRRLESEGWVKSKPHMGVVVTDISLEEAEENYGLRRILEIIAVKDVCQKISPDSLNQLKKLHERMGSFLEEPIKFRQLNMDFHFILFNESGNKTLVNVLQSLWYTGLRYQASFHQIPNRTILSHEEHGLMIKALEKKDSREFKILTLRHLDRALDNIREYASNLGKGGSDVTDRGFC